VDGAPGHLSRAAPLQGSPENVGDDGAGTCRFRRDNRRGTRDFNGMEERSWSDEGIGVDIYSQVHPFKLFTITEVLGPQQVFNRR